MVAVILFGAFLVFVALGMPVAFAMGVAAVVAVLATGDLPLLVVAQRMYTGIDSYLLMAIPFFLLAGEIMSDGGIAQRLIAFARAVLGHVRGGLAVASTAASIVFSGVSGSAAADVSAIGSIVTKPLIREGYSPGFTASMIATAGVLGPIIPPSILMVVYASITNVSIAALFLAGVIPGVLLGVAIMAMGRHYAIRHGIPRVPFAGWRAVGRSAWEAIPALIAPLIIIAGIVGGIFTATEAGVIAVLYVLPVSLFFYRQLSVRDLPRILVRTGFMTATLMFVVATSSAFSYVLAYHDVPRAVIAGLTAISQDRYVLLILILGLIFLIGTVVDVIPAALILVPILHPLAAELGFDPIHFALIMVIALQTGGLTPPVGVLLFIACGLAGIKPRVASPYVWWFVLMLFVATVALAFLPDVVLWLPKLFLGR
jgi:C4-dicarboxylate transporter DctM subunit